ncbi:MAG: aldehyde dehydrogenase family protein [Gammaproteobacteria bacterium]|nr:aldehyde dehydrogenase family protein [Gammaproteobacteria bacterium]
MSAIPASLGLRNRNPGVSSGGRWHASGKAKAFASLNPATNEPLGTVTAASARDYEQVIRNSTAAFRAWREVPAPRRGEAVRRIADALRGHKDALGTLVSLEAGKIKAEGDGEVQEMIDIADFAVGLSRQLYGLTMPSERPSHRLYEQWQPLGVVGIISAFNFPVAVWSWNAFIAAVCGNASVWKPSPKTPLCSIAVQNICNRTLAAGGYPPIFSLFNTTDNRLAERFVDDHRVDLVSFTGSTAVGRKVAERVAARLGKYLLELGGNNAIIIDEHANLDLAVPAILFGAVGTAGQRCTTTRRLLVHPKLVKELTRRLVAAYQQVPIGNPLRKGTLMGPLIDEAAVERYLATVRDVRRLGGEILCGGERLKRGGNFVKPTIVMAKANWAPVQQECFAPILYVIPTKNLDEAIAVQNGVPQGLSSAIFTDRLQHAERFLSAAGSDCGIANVNIGTSGAEIGGAFGGEKETGGGREAGSDSWKAYMRRQTVTINWGNDLPLAQGIDFSV